MLDEFFFMFSYVDGDVPRISFRLRRRMSGGATRESTKISHRFTRINTGLEKLRLMTYLCPSVFICGRPT